MDEEDPFLLAERREAAALRAERDLLAARVRELEAEVMQARERFDVFAATLPGISWETWGEPYLGIVNYVSASATDISGYTPEEWQSRPGFCHELVHPDDRARVLQEAVDSVARGDLGGVQEYRLVRRDGEVICVHVRYTILRTETGEAFAWQAFSLDITQLRQAEADRDRMQDELIRGQAELLSELSTPLMPISDEVLVMPLIGRVDEARAQRVIEVLLRGLAQARAGFAILDITGVPAVDADVARALLQAARAARLLGVETIITGVRPEVAQELVAIDERLTGVATLGTLQAGVAHALRRGRDGERRRA